MAANPGQPHTEEEVHQPQPSLSIHVLSPSPELPNHLSLTSISPSLTVRQLKEHIRDATTARPATDRQRLIHRGRMLGNDAETLQEVFSQVATDDPTAHSLHLVLRPENEGSRSASAPVFSPGQRATPTPSNPTTSRLDPDPATARSQAQQAPLLPNPHLSYQPPMLPTSPSYGPSPLSTGAALHPSIALTHGAALHPSVALSHGAPHMQNMIQSQLALLNQQQAQLNRQMFPQQLANGQVPVPYSPGQAVPGMRQPVQGPMSTQAFQHYVGQAQRARAAAGMHGVGNEPTRVNAQEPPSSAAAAAVAPTAHQSAFPASSTSFRQEVISPDGQRWQMTINEGTMTIPTAGFAPVAPTGGHVAQNVATAGTSSGATAASTNTSSTRPTASNSASNLTTPMTVSQTAPSSAPLMRSVSTGTMRVPVAIPTPISAASSAVYVLASPAGPYALLVSPSGTYTTGSRTMASQGLYSQQQHFNSRSYQTAYPWNMQANAVHQPFQRQVPPNVGVVPATAGRAVAVGNRAAEPDQRQAPQAPAQGAVQGANEEQGGDLVRLLLPLGGHLWLLIRLLGFVYFFTGGSGWRRTLIILLGALLVFIAQTPMFAGVQEMVWGPIRRHIEGLLPPVPLQQGEAQDDEPAGGEPRAARQNDDGNRANGAEPLDPAETAARLVRQRREREREQRSWLAQSIRGVERAVILLLASLVPGVGERQVAAREAEERERERARLERERLRIEREREAEEARAREQNLLEENREGEAGGEGAQAETEGGRQGEEDGTAGQQGDT